MKKEKIELYRMRTFSEKLGATFDFITENGKLMFRFMLYILLPLSILQSVGLSSFVENTIRASVDESLYTDKSMLFTMAGGYALCIIAACVGSVLCTSMVYGLMRLYNERDERLAGLTLREFKPMLLRGAGRSFRLGLVLGLIITALLAAIAGLAWTAFGTGGGLSGVLLAYVAIIVCAFPLCLTVPAYLLEDIKMKEAVGKGMRLGFKTWGGVFAVVFVLGIVMYIIAGVATMPWYIMIVAKGVFVMTDTMVEEGFITSPLYSFIMFLLSVLPAFFTYVGEAFLCTGIGIQYGHAADKIDHVSVERDVDNFERLADTSAEDNRLFAGGKDDIDRFGTL